MVSGAFYVRFAYKISVDDFFATLDWTEWIVDFLVKFPFFFTIFEWE